MNPKKLVKLSNIIGTVSIILLIYWVFIFVSIEVFGLKVFRQNLTDTFFMSVLGILALMFGALIINVMFNLTRIAEKHNQDDSYTTSKQTKNIGWLIILSFPVIFGLLYGGDMLTSRKKQAMLVHSAKSVAEGHTSIMTKMLNYTFSRKWINETAEDLYLLSNMDKNFRSVTVVVLDTFRDARVFLQFAALSMSDDTVKPAKKDFLMETAHSEREYLNRVFDHKEANYRFTADDGNYEMYYPFTQNGKTIVLYFTDYQRYGKLGS